MFSLLQPIFSLAPFIPHGHCYLWKPELVGLHVTADVLIALSYYSIPIMLIYFVCRRRGTPFPWLFWLFSSFIAACGTTHLLEAWTLWYPAYWLSGGMKAFTALVSAYTAVELFPIIPLALALPDPKILEVTNQRLAAEVQERQKTEQALQESERRFRAIFNQTFQFMGVMQPDGLLIEANQTALDFGGLVAADVIGRPFWEARWWSQSLDTQRQLQQAIARAATGEFIRYEVEVVGTGETIATLDFSIKPVRDETGTVVLLIPEGREITQRKRAEAEIHRLNQELEARVVRRTAQLEAANQQKEQLLVREQEARSQLEAAIAEVRIYTERLSLALDAAKLGLWDWDMKTDQVFWTPHHELILGYKPGQANRSYADWAQRVYPDDLPQAEAAVQQAIANQEEYTAEYRVIWPDGSIHWLVGIGRGYYDAQGHPLRMLGIVQEITERKQAEAALRESEEKFRATFEQAAVGFAHVSLDGHWIQVNQKLCDILGYTREELLERSFQEITIPEDLPADLEAIQQLMANTIQTITLEKRYICKNGTLVWVNLTASLVRDFPTTCDRPLTHSCTVDGAALGKPKYFIAVIEDIGQRKQAELELQRRAQELRQLNQTLICTTALLKKRNQELDQFAYVVSHDLKAPLRAIMNLSEWIEEDLQGQLPPENQQQMQLLRGRVHRMEALIDGLLEYSRAGRGETKIERVAVADLLADVVDSLAPPATFTVEIAPDLPTFITKQLLLAQVFANLIGNAIKHHDRPDGRIQVSVHEQEEFYEFAVSDDGPGIPPEYHDRIFGIFQTLKSRDTLESTGIGLSIVKKTVETEGGFIQLESEAGQGTTFRFTWPKQPKAEVN